MKLDAVFLPQLDALRTEFNYLRQRSKHDDLSDLTPNDLLQFITRVRAAVPRVAGPSSIYAKQCEEIVESPALYPNDKATYLMGVLSSLHVDLKAGYLQTVSELIRGELFGDFLDMADHLAKEGYKDAAAVIGGSALEAHLRALCEGAAAISVTMPDGRPKKADTLNADLVTAEVYGKLDQKNVTSWLDLRNKAAHGHYSEYTLEQVKLLIMGVRDFMTRNPS